MSQPTKSALALLSKVGLTTEDELLSLGEDDPVLDKVANRLASVYWTFESHEKNYDVALSEIRRTSRRETERLEDGFTTDPTWVLQQARLLEEADRGMKAAVEQFLLLAYVVNQLRPAATS